MTECYVLLLYLTGSALVYGCALEAYTMVQMLLAAGVQGCRIVLVQPPVTAPTCFNNPDIDDAVRGALAKLGEKSLK